MPSLVPALSLLAAVALPATLAAQPLAGAESPWHVVPGLHAGTPAIVSVTVAVARTIERRPEGWRDVFLALEPGIAAGRLSAGYGRFTGNLATGYTVRATALRRWKDTSANYTGVEASLHTVFLGPRVGVFVPLGHGDTRRVMLSVDLAFGY